MMARLAKSIAIVVLFVAAGATALVFLWPSFGGPVAGKRLERARQSPQFKDGVFVNVIPQSERTTSLLWAYAGRQFNGSEVRVPPRAIPFVKLDAPLFNRPPGRDLRAIWFGHASVYLEVDGVRVMVDPILTDWASPVAGIGPKRFHPPPIELAAMPMIDAVLISHDHYDHLDMASIKHLSAAGSHFYVPLGIGAHLDRWGVPEAQYTELDWWQAADVNGVRLTSAPVRHYSGRGLRDKNATLWTSWSIAGPTQKVYFSGDTGFGDHFAAIGARLGPFDLSIIKIGAYGPGQPWIDIHMEPEDSVRAHLAVRAKRLLPVHWGTFNLAFHAWDEPIKRTVEAARAQGVDIATPRIGEAVTAAFVSSDWWSAIK